MNKIAIKTLVSLRPVRPLSLFFAAITALLTLHAAPALSFDYLKYAAGIGSGYVIHEASHQTVAGINGTPFHWKSGFGSTWVASSNAPAGERAQLAGAGLASQMLTTEIILGSEGIPKDSEYVIGILTFNIANAILYVISDSIVSPNDNYGDIEMMDKADLDRDYTSTVLIAHSLYSLYRVYYKTNIPAYISVNKNEIRLGVTLYRW